MKNWIWIAVGVLVLGAAGGAYWWYANQGKTCCAPSQTGGTQIGNVTEVSVSAKEYAFTPKTFTVKKGENIRVTFTNSGSTFHTFTISGIADSGYVAPGSTTPIDFTAPKVAGSYQYYCAFPGHKDFGMVGTMEVK